MSEVFLRDVMSRQWRGNVRELRSYLEQAVVFSDGGVLDEPMAYNPSHEEKSPTPPEAIVPLQAMLEVTERIHILT